jgi:predicted transcriptional regulator
MARANLDFETALHVRVPIALTEAVMRAAEERMMTSSDYIRQALIDRLKLEKRSVKTLTEA